MISELNPPNEKLFLSHELARIITNVFFRTQFSNHRLLGLFCQLNSNRLHRILQVAALLLASVMKGSLFNTNCHEWPVNFREYFLTECFWSHAESAEDAENALLRSHGLRDEGLFV